MLRLPLRLLVTLVMSIVIVAHIGLSYRLVKRDGGVRSSYHGAPDCQYRLTLRNHNG